MRHRHDDEEEDEERLLRRIARELEIITDILLRILARLTPRSTTAVLSIGDPMPLSVGGTTTATLTFVDGTQTPPVPAPPPTGDGSGLTVTFSSDNTAVATVDATGTASGDDVVTNVQGISAGSYNLSAVVANTSGAPLVDDDGVTPFVQPAAANGEVTGAAVSQATTATITIA